MPELRELIAQAVACVPLEQYLADLGLVATGPLGASERLLVACPFHDDELRSLEIRGGNPADWRCWGDCQDGGTIVALVKRHQALTTWAALAFLDSRYRLGLELPCGLKVSHLLAPAERQRRDRRGRLSPLAEAQACLPLAG